MSEGSDREAALLCAPDDLEAAARSKIYALLTRAYSYPDGEVFEQICSGALIGDLQHAIEDSPLLIEPAATRNVLFTQFNEASLRSTYSGLFDVTGGTPKISLLERNYRQDPEQQLWEKLLRFYGHFGLDFSNGYTQEQPDHLATELSFMHYLSFLQARMSPDYESIGRGQVDFLSRHLFDLSKGIDRQFAEINPSNIYEALGKCLHAVIAADLAYMEAKFCADKIEEQHRG